MPPRHSIVCGRTLERHSPAHTVVAPHQAAAFFSTAGAEARLDVSAQGNMAIKGFSFIELRTLAGSLTVNPQALSITAASLRAEGRVVRTNVAIELSYDAPQKAFGMVLTMDSFGLQVSGVTSCAQRCTRLPPVISLPLRVDRLSKRRGSACSPSAHPALANACAWLPAHPPTHLPHPPSCCPGHTQRVGCCGQPGSGRHQGPECPGGIRKHSDAVGQPYSGGGLVRRGPVGTVS